MMCEQRKAKCEPLYSHLGFYSIFMLIDNMYITGNCYLEFQVSSKRGDSREKNSVYCQGKY